MNGEIVWSSVQNPLNGGGSLIGLSIDKILSPVEAEYYTVALCKAAFGQGPQIHYYTVLNSPFMVLAEYIKHREIFVVQEAEIVSTKKEHIEYLKEQLWLRSMSWHEEFDQVAAGGGVK